MANPQKEKGGTIIASEVMEALCKFRIPGEVRQIVDVVIRQTWGWNKKEDWISNSQFVEKTGMRKGNVCRSLSKAITHRLVIQSDNGYRFNKDYESWLSFERTVIISATKVIKKDNKLLSKVRDTIYTTNNTLQNTITHTVIQSDNKYLEDWKKYVGTTLRKDLPQNVNAAIRIENVVGEERLRELLLAVRIIRGGKYNHRGLQVALVNFIGLENKLEEVEAFMQGQVDTNIINSNVSVYE